jgi:hypothetical protein
MSMSKRGAPSSSSPPRRSDGKVERDNRELAISQVEDRTNVAEPCLALSRKQVQVRAPVNLSQGRVYLYRLRPVPDLVAVYT